MRSFFAILAEVTTRVGGKKDAVVWRVRVNEGSNLVGVEPEPGYSSALVGQIAHAVAEGLADIRDESKQPTHFSERALRNLRDLAKLVTDDSDTSIRVWVRKEPIPLTPDVATRVSELLATEHEDFGSIEGRLETLSGRKGLHFVIYEPMLGEAVRCYIDNDEQLNVAMTNFRKRVEVYGTIKYRKDGKAVSIRVEEIVPFPSSGELPSFRDVHGILRKAV